MPIDRFATGCRRTARRLTSGIKHCGKSAAGAWGWGIHRKGVERLGIPNFILSDGPHGVRQEMRYDDFVPVAGYDDATTYLPTGIALGATWSIECAQAFGDVLGAEARARGKDVILGPGVNLIRTPLMRAKF